jgi:hypothetical protein
LTDYYRDEGVRKESKEFTDIPLLDMDLLNNNLIEYDCMICMNDWDKKVVQPAIINAKESNKVTIGIVEGVQDFFDLDIDRIRNTYNTVEHVFLTGEHD